MSIIARQTPEVAPPEPRRDLIAVLLRGVAMGIEITLLVLSPVLAFALWVAYDRSDRDLARMMEHPGAALVAGLLAAAALLWIRLPFTIHHALRRPLSPGPSARLLARNSED